MIIDEFKLPNYYEASFHVIPTFFMQPVNKYSILGTNNVTKMDPNNAIQSREIKCLTD